MGERRKEGARQGREVEMRDSVGGREEAWDIDDLQAAPKCSERADVFSRNIGKTSSITMRTCALAHSFPHLLPSK